jgi:hypothetical protein
MNLQIFIDLFTFFAIVYVGIHQHLKISSLQTAVGAQKQVLDSITSYFNIINVDEFKKYVQLREENMKEEAKRDKEATLRAIAANVKDRLDQLKEDQFSFLPAVIDMLVTVPPQLRLRFLESYPSSKMRDSLISTLPSMEQYYFPSMSLELIKLNEEKAAS